MPRITLATESLSIYEIDTDAQQVCRLGGSGEPTPRVANRTTYQSCSYSLGEPLIVAWGYNEDNNVIEVTVTSPVVSIQGD